MSTPRSGNTDDADLAYERYVKPLEASHQGEYALVTQDGRTHFAPTLLQLAEKARQMPSRDNFLFKVGEKAIGQLL